MSKGIVPADCVEIDVKRASARSPYSVLVVGWNKPAEQVLLSQIVQGQLGADGVVHAVVLCREAREASANFSRDYPDIKKCAEVVFEETSEDEAALLQSAKIHFFGVNGIIVSCGSAEKSKTVAAVIEAAFKEFFNVNYAAVFVAEDELTDPDEEAFENAAMTIHGLYEAQKAAKNPNYVIKPWNELLPTIREINVDVIRNAKVKLRLVGLTDRNACNAVLKSRESFSAYLGAARLTALAKQEHQRWNAFYFVRGWRTMSLAESDKLSAKAGCRVTKDMESKKHICLVSWDGLDELDFIDPDYKKYDEDNVLRIPELYASFPELFV